MRNIEHEGIIISKSGDCAVVEIVSKSACADCHAKGMCSASDMKKKHVDVRSMGEGYAVGEKVRVVAAESLGVSAILLAYVMPLLVVVLVLVACAVAKTDDAMAGLSSLGAAAIYFVVLALFRGRLQRTFIFSIQKQ